MTAINAPTVLTPVQVAALCPPIKAGQPVHPATVCRWITRGVRLADETILRLAATRYPGGWAISPDALNGFLAALTAAALGEETGEPTDDPATPSARRRKELAGVDRDLDALGITTAPTPTPPRRDRPHRAAK
jgi:hypothetical protein